MAKELTLPLATLIGIPIADLVRAEQQAAQASIDFITEVGFRRDARAPADDLGELRLVTFVYRSSDEPDGPTVRRVQVPLLSLLPLPLIQVEKAEIEIAARIDAVTDLPVGSVSVWRVGAKGAAESREFVATVDTLSDDSSVTARSPRMRFKITLKQSDLPGGVAYLLRKLDQAGNADRAR